ncbi:hypothetical protein B0H66DRAFT_336668 [Apodospora peruviana]|uniref:Uncharacterized protein n=1 Tax=Apodospora peruviana TaxID=516989 RepID=A0AAE0HYX1_9PEZI|nr:hypothetical protein B0H66DRAFT_336668 [Apodospora peruviana]
MSMGSQSRLWFAVAVRWISQPVLPHLPTSLPKEVRLVRYVPYLSSSRYLSTSGIRTSVRYLLVPLSVFPWLPSVSAARWNNQGTSVPCSADCTCLFPVSPNLPSPKEREGSYNAAPSGISNLYLDCGSSMGIALA